MDSLSTRSIAEHFCTLATLLEAEAMRQGAIGVQSTRNLYQEAVELRGMADRLWQLNAMLPLPAATPEPATEIRHVTPADGLRRTDRLPSPHLNDAIASGLRHRKSMAPAREGWQPGRAASSTATAPGNNTG